MKNILLYIWQILQNIVGLICILLFNGKKINNIDGVNIYVWKLDGSMSLGNYVFLDACDLDAVKHELNHSRQSRILGPLYLFVIGIPSILHCIAWVTYYDIFRKVGWDYYKFYTEHWMFKD